MKSLPHGGRLIDRVLRGEARERALEHVARLPRLDLTPGQADDLFNIAVGIFSPLEGFMGRAELKTVLEDMRLPSGVPSTIPIVLPIDQQVVAQLGTRDELTLYQRGHPLALLEVTEVFPYDKIKFAERVFGTTDAAHPGVRQLQGASTHLIAGRINLIEESASSFARYRLKPVETRILFSSKGWRTIVGFQTRNVPHLGHEYLQKTALSFVDGLFINPVIGRKKPGDFKDEVILRAYEALLGNYYLRQRAVLAILQTEMRYAGPREAVFHAILRKNFGCTHFIVGRDHAGVGQFYPPYAAQEIFDRFPDLGIVPLFAAAFFYCERCGGVANEKSCPHPEAERLPFSGTLLRELVKHRATDRLDPSLCKLVRPEVAAVVSHYQHPLVEENPSESS